MVYVYRTYTDILRSVIMGYINHFQFVSMILSLLYASLHLYSFFFFYFFNMTVYQLMTFTITMLVHYFYFSSVKYISPLFSHLPSPSVPYAPIISGLVCSTQRFRKSQRPRCFGTRMYSIGAEIVWCKTSFGGLKWPSAWKALETCRAEMSWGRIVFGPTLTFVSGAKWFPCNETSIGRNGLVPKCLATELKYAVNQSTKNSVYTNRQISSKKKFVHCVVNLASVCERNCKIQQENSCFHFLRCLPVYLPKLLLFSVKVKQVSCFGDYGFSSEVPREGERV